MQQLFTEGDVVTALLRNQGKTQEDLVALINVSRSKLSLLLNSSPILPVDLKSKIAKALKVEVEVFDIVKQSGVNEPQATYNADAMKQLLSTMKRIEKQNDAILKHLGLSET